MELEPCMISFSNLSILNNDSAKKSKPCISLQNNFIETFVKFLKLQSVFVDIKNKKFSIHLVTS